MDSGEETDENATVDTNELEEIVFVLQKDGKVVWEYNFGKSNADSSPVLADNKVYFGVGEGGDGYFYSFNANNGEVIWKEKLGGSSGALAEGILIVQNKLAEEELKPETPVIIAFSDKGSVTK